MLFSATLTRNPAKLAPLQLCALPISPYISLYLPAKLALLQLCALA